jgi:dienelactone hydrolase
MVYKAEDLRLGRVVALKFLPSQLVRDPDAKRRFFQEARTASSIDLSSEECEAALPGLSWGGRLGPIIIALDPRIKADVLLMGGLASNKSAPEVDPFNFAPRVRVPVLMLNGDQDFIFPLQTSQRPLFQALGTPSADKKHVLYPRGHEIFATQRSQIVQEVVGWLDRYVGRVQ